MKLIIDIPKKDYEEIMAEKKHQPRILSWSDRLISNGIPLEDIKAEIKAYKDSVDKAISEDELKREGMKLAYQDSLEIIDKHIGVLLADIKNAPPVNPQQKTGHWIKSSIGGAKICSICQAHMGLSSFKFCPNCGAKMRDVKECNTCKHQLKFMCSEWKECKDKSKYEPQESEE